MQGILSGGVRQIIFDDDGGEANGQNAIGFVGFTVK